MSYVSGTIVPADFDDGDFDQLFPLRFVPLPPLEDALSSDHVSRPNELPPLSENAKALLGRREAVKTTRDNEVEMRSLAKFLYRFEGSEADLSNDDELLQHAKKNIFKSRT